MRDLDRRDVLAGLVAAGTAPLLGAVPARAAPGDAAANAALNAAAEALLVEHPESATSLGIDTGARAPLRAALTDRSPDGVARAQAAAAARLKSLDGIDRSRLSAATALAVDVARVAHRYAADGARFGYGDVVTLWNEVSYRNSPYVVAQNMGAFVEVPDFLDSIHPLHSAADAEAYLSRLSLYARALDGETARLMHDASLGVVLPRFLLDRTLAQMTRARAKPVGEWQLVSSLATRATFAGDWRARAEKIVASEIAPALDRQIAALTALQAKAPAEAGAWTLPQGDAFYAWALAAGTTTTRTPDEVHALGQEELKRLHAMMDTILRAQGLTQGSVGERMTALAGRPDVLFADTDAGRAELLAYVNGRVVDIRRRLPRAFHTLVPGRIEVKRVPPEIEGGAPDGYAGPGAIDGSRPGYYYINLRTTTIWPRYALPTLSYHEGLPGHVWQGEYSYRLPLIRSLLAFNAYSEGWALYAEQLADELGVYEGDPLGKLGYLQSLAFRACRLVVDTGIHARRWTHEQAIDWMATTNGTPREAVRGEVYRYCVWPGQACGYKVGHSEINRIRAATQARLGKNFDGRRFNDAVVTSGNVPLTLLPGVVARGLG